MVNYTKKVISGAGNIFIFSLLAAVFSYLLRLLLARNLSLEDFGLFFAVFTFVTFFLIFQDAGLGSSLVKFINEFKTRKEFDNIKTSIYYVLGIQTVFTLIIAALIIIFADFLALSYFQDPKSKIIIIILAVWFIINNLAIIISYIFYGLQKMFLYSSRFFLINILVFIITAILLWKGLGIMAPVYAYLISAILASIIYFPILVKKFNFFKYKFIKSNKLLKKIVVFAIPMIPVLMAAKIIGYSDILMMTYYRSLEEVGIYSVVLPTAILLLFFGKSIHQIIFPISNELVIKNEKKKLREGVKQLQKYLFLLVSPFAAVMFSFPKLFLKLFFGVEFVSGALSMQILLVGVVFFVLAQISTGVLMGIGKPDKYAMIIGIAAILNVAFNFVLIPKYGMVGAAVSTAISYILIFVIVTIYLIKEINLEIPLFDWIKTFISTLIFISLIYVLKGLLTMNLWVELFIVLSISFIVYILLVFLLRITNRKEIEGFFTRIIKK